MNTQIKSVVTSEPVAKVGGALTKVIGRTTLQLQKHSPEILLAVGITGIVGASILACRATLKADGVMDRHREKINAIKDAVETLDPEEYSDQDHKRDLTVTYVQTFVDFIRLYGPAVTLGIASIACLIGGHNIMSKRNVALIAAYKAVEEGFNAYRKRVIDEYGEDKDYMFKHDLHEEEISETVTDEDGKTKKVKTKKMVQAENPSGLSQYARFFDETSSEWRKDPEQNKLFLLCQQRYFNDLLQAKGHVFLNDVYNALGLDPTPAGQIVGWVISKDGDNFIDFGIFDGDRQAARAFVNGWERSVLLDFNVDGVVYDKI